MSRPAMPTAVRQRSFNAAILLVSRTSMMSLRWGVFAIADLLWFRDVRFLRHQRNPTRGTWEARSPDGPTKPGARVGGEPACTEAGASRQASTDGAGLAAAAAAVHPGERKRRLTGETTERSAERPE